MEEMGKLTAEMTAKGVLVCTGAIMQAAQGAHVTLSNGDYKVRDGAGQVLQAGAVGFAILQAPTKGAVLQHMKSFLKVAGDGVIDMFPLIGPPPR